MGKTIQVSGFPFVLSAEDIKVFLERHTGQGIIYALQVRQFKSGSRGAYAIVQFMHSRDGNYIISQASSGLWYGSSYLKAPSKERDIVPKPRTFLHTMEHIALGFGCRISEERFSVLWGDNNVPVNFGFGLKKMNFFLSYHNVEYRLELSLENIWQMELRKPLDQLEKYLLIQVVIHIT